ncbi:MAG: 4Fe-4S dicluster domain-containing protein [Chloroflexi bacterium]|nr:4Fe-4S dicluster domain-containing protein [Chloroflexota bacterium]
MKVNIYYFSGTGNTAWMAHRLAERLTELSNDVVAMSCEDISASTVDPTSCDVMGIAFPVYSSFAPIVVRDFLEEIPPGEGRPLFAVTTAGYMAGDTAWYAVKPLQDKGYEPFLLGNVVMGNNFYIPPMDFLPVTLPEKMPRKLEKANRKIANLAELVHQRKSRVEGADPFGRLLGIGQRWGMKFESLVFKDFFSDENCTQCGWCVRHCPVNNIEMNGAGAKFLGDCMLCLRCYSFCPGQAIQVTEKTKNTEKYRRYQGPEGKPYHN